MTLLKRRMWIGYFRAHKIAWMVSD